MQIVCKKKNENGQHQSDGKSNELLVCRIIEHLQTLAVHFSTVQETAIK